ncbi:MAG: RNA polymerase subunit sigma [Ferrovum sp. 37-45-19]|uniref:sigma-70 family RNA polymerase sigma factor n=1 Tax=Ferrovum sp. JA12 TaxID=1356299 RepID=UPI0007034E48|nr:sigma-70 family RNA polymerase sigma factor [Ferrovum sp. JA12]OYV79062.1 MAG: RNA polymerase subunit sigma [Ferrovum sp. 21-44-67]OYV93702.1 MAG: RNA polymerase subunit sigma [Ferrovum sp. 37-45-19]OZB31679.1 MAG: RNA polymerase subunit sigma [Ferrovum sp. 34-44-207]HQT82452.1 sigma-70 family RNA polymerase sigma factor [Ferrovaceae bacterium]KRH78394.1 ECF RNA polymerase sigma factor SigE [Ferrovum sp. JA12]
MNTLESALTSNPRLLEEMRRTMMKFALLQLGEIHAAEDVVQEAILGALKNSQQFQGESAFKTWVFAILKNKIIDLIRQKNRSINISSFSVDDEADLDELFDQQGHWLPGEKPQAWTNPEQQAEDKQFWVILEMCLDRLPKQQAQLFMMREHLGLEVKEIGVTLRLTVTNINVLLYRARLRLRECLENNWYMNNSVNNYDE